MTTKNPFKFPFIVAFVISLFFFSKYLNRQGFIKKRRQILQSTPCIAGLLKLEKKIKKNWDIQCEKNDLIVVIHLENSPKFADLNFKRAYFYREMANSLAFISKNSPAINLENTDYVNVTLKNGSFSVVAKTQGNSLAKLATLKGPESIKEHLKNTVKVKEIGK
jgi:hypothetical protein